MRVCMAQLAQPAREKMSGGPRKIGPISKVAGSATGIGLQNDDENRAGNVTMVASVAEDSPFAGMLTKGDEILEVNGVDVKGKAKAAAQAIVQADSLELLIQTPSQMLGIITSGKGKKK